MSDFHEVLFPTDISLGSSGGPKWKTAIFSADSGFEARVSDWTSTRAEYDVSYGIKTSGQIETLAAFFMNRRGRAYGFRFKDWNDYEATNVRLGVGDYATREFQIVKTYRNEGQDGVAYTFNRPLKKIEWGSEEGVLINGIAITRATNTARHYAIDYNTGKITLNTPLLGGFYAGTTPGTAADMILPAEGGTANNVVSTTFHYGAIPLDIERGYAFVLSTFNGDNSDRGIRKIDLPQAKEVAHASGEMIGGPYTDYAGIICVDPNGFIYVNAGGAANGQPIVKIDGANLTYVTHWGVVNSAIASPNTSSYPASPGAASLDGETFVHVGFFGNIVLHQTSDCARVRELFDLPGSVSIDALVAPYTESGFAVVHNSTGTDYGCVLRICFRHINYEALTFGIPGSVPRACYWDRKTGGVLVLWEDSQSSDDGAWAGLWHTDTGGFVWTRRLPCSLGNYGLTGGSCAVPLDGELFWANDAPQYYPLRMWRLDTETGLLEARAIATNGNQQAYDPTRRILIMAVNNATTPIRQYSTDLAGVPWTPPEVLDLSSVRFHVGVRFDTDHLNLKSEFWTYGSFDSIPLVEVRNWDDLEID